MPLSRGVEHRPRIETGAVVGDERIDAVDDDPVDGVGGVGHDRGVTPHVFRYATRRSDPHPDTPMHLRPGRAE